MSLKSVIDIFAKAIKISRFPSLLVVLGFVAFVISYTSYTTTGFHFPVVSPHLFFLFLGGVLIVLGVILYSHNKQTRRLKIITLNGEQPMPKKDEYNIHYPVMFESPPELHISTKPRSDMKYITIKEQRVDGFIILYKLNQILYAQPLFPPKPKLLWRAKGILRYK